MNNETLISYTVTNCDGPEHFDTRAEAMAYASELVDDYRDESLSANEWPSEVGTIEVHERKLIARSSACEVRLGDHCDYSLTPTEDRIDMTTNPQIKITTIEQARKWVGRKARVGYGPTHYDTPYAMREAYVTLTAPCAKCGSPTIRCTRTPTPP